jgi:hypothetical protein
MKKNTASPKKRPRRRHKRKQLKSRPRRSLRQRLEHLSALQQALAAIQSVASASRSPEVESEPEVPLPTRPPGKLLWDVTMNSESGDVPRVCGLAPYQRPPRTPSLLIAPLAASTPPLTVHAAVSRRPSVRCHQPSPRTLMFSNTKPGLTPPEHPAQHPQRFPLLWRAPLTLVMTQRPESRRLEQTLEKTLPHDQPSLPHSQPPCRRFRSLQALAQTVIANGVSRVRHLSFDHKWKNAYYEKVFFEKPLKAEYLKKYTKQFRKKIGFIRKRGSHHKKQLSKKIIGSLQKQRPGLSIHRQLQGYAKQTPRLLRAAAKALLTKRFKLLAPEIKKRSQLFTQVPVAELLRRQASSFLRYPPNELPLKSGQPTFVTDNTTREKLLPVGNREGSTFCKPISVTYDWHEILLLNRATFNEEQTYPAVIADQLPKAGEVFDKEAAKQEFRELYGFTKTTPGPKWEFRRAERLFVRLKKRLPKTKQALLEQFGGVPEVCFHDMAAEIDRLNQLGLTEQDYMIREMWCAFSECLADFNQLVQNLASAGLLETVALSRSNTPLHQGVASHHLPPPSKQQDNSLNHDHPF